jgi:hypothetical protein
MGTKGNVYGEGNYEATRQYNEATKKFVESGKVEEAARDAAPRSPEEAQEMKQAEQAALLRAKESPPEIKEPPEEKDPAIDDPVRQPAQGRSTQR